MERTRVRLESSRASTRKSYAVPDIPWGPATKGGGLGLDQLGRPRARRQASTPRGLAASPKGIAPQTREREELTMRRALRTTPLSQERVGGESEEPAQPECWRGRRAWRGHRAGTAPGQEEQRESCRSTTQRARPRGTRNVLGRTSRPECSRRKSVKTGRRDEDPSYGRRSSVSTCTCGKVGASHDDELFTLGSLPSCLGTPSGSDLK